MMKNDSNRVIERLNDGRSIKDWLVVLKWNDKKSEWMASIASKCSNFLVCIKTNFTYKGQRKTFLNLYIVKTGFRGYFGSICLKKKVFHAIHKYTSIQKHCFFFLRTIYFQTHMVFLEIVGVKWKDQDPLCWIFFFEEIKLRSWSSSVETVKFCMETSDGILVWDNRYYNSNQLIIGVEI